MYCSVQNILQPQSRAKPGSKGSKCVNRECRPKKSNNRYMKIHSWLIYIIESKVRKNNVTKIAKNTSP